MADGTFNIAKGKVARYAMLPEASDGLVAVLLKTAEADDTLNNHDTLAAALAGSNVECDFTSYARQALTGVTVTVNDTTNLIDVDADDLVYTSVGGATNNTTAKLLICYDPATGSGTDTEIIPLSHHDLAFTTDGSTVTVQFPSGGFWRAQEA